MEWDHFRQTLGQGQPDRIKLKLLLDNTPFIIDFLSRLLEVQQTTAYLDPTVDRFTLALTHIQLCRQCQTHEEIVALYPQASQALTLASVLYNIWDYQLGSVTNAVCTTRITLILQHVLTLHACSYLVYWNTASFSMLRKALHFNNMDCEYIGVRGKCQEY